MYEKNRVDNTKIFTIFAFQFPSYSEQTMLFNSMCTVSRQYFQNVEVLVHFDLGKCWIQKFNFLLIYSDIHQRCKKLYTVVFFVHFLVFVFLFVCLVFTKIWLKLLAFTFVFLFFIVLFGHFILFAIQFKNIYSKSWLRWLSIGHYNDWIQVLFEAYIILTNMQF